MQTAVSGVVFGSPCCECWQWANLYFKGPSCHLLTFTPPDFNSSLIYRFGCFYFSSSLRVSESHLTPCCVQHNVLFVKIPLHQWSVPPLRKSICPPHGFNVPDNKILTDSLIFVAYLYFSQLNIHFALYCILYCIVLYFIHIRFVTTINLSFLFFQK